VYDFLAGLPKTAKCLPSEWKSWINSDPPKELIGSLCANFLNKGIDHLDTIWIDKLQGRPPAILR
jgi:hypothetical protein